MKNKSTLKTLLGLLGGSILCILPLQIQAQTTGEDMTSRIVNPSFEGEQSRVPTNNVIVGGGNIYIPNGWTLNKALGGWNGINLIQNSEANPSYEGDKYFDLWKSAIEAIDFNQTITSLPAGKYELKAAMKVPQENSAFVTDQHIYAIAEIDGITYQSPTLSSTSVGAHGWEVLPIIFSLSASQDITIGGASTGPNKDTPAGWFSIDDFRLTYLGEAEPLKMADIMKALDEKSTIANTFYEDNMPIGTYQTLTDVNNIYLSMTEETSLEEAQSILARFTKAIKDAKEGELLFDTLYTYINKSKDVPSDFPNYAEFESIYLEKYDVLGAVESTNIEFKEAITILRKAYEEINLNNMSLATQEEARDASWLLANPKFTKSGQQTSDKTAATTDGWKINYAYAAGQEQWIGMGLTQAGPSENEKVNAYNFNAWFHAYVEVEQELNNLPEGTYSLSCDLNLLSETKDSWIYANTKYEQQIQHPSYQYNEKADPPTPYWQTVTTEKTYVGKDGYLKVGFYSKNPTTWNYIGVNMTNFKLNYHGKKGSADKLVDELIKEAKALKDSVEIEKMIMPVEKRALTSVIEQAEAAEDKNEVLDPIKNVIANVKECVALYPQVEIALSKALDYLSAGQNMAEPEDTEEFDNLINNQLIILEADTTSRYALIGIKKDLHDGMVRYQFKLTKQATENNPVDITLVIANPTIEILANSIPEGWTCSRNISGNYTNTGEHFTGNRENRYLDANCGTAGQLKFTAKQTLIVPNGTYILQCAGRTNGQGIYLFANTEQPYTAAFDSCGNTRGNVWEKAIDGSPEKLVNGGQGYGWGWVNLPNIKVTQRSIEIGITSDVDVSKGDPWKGTWLSADDFTLLCTQGEGLVGIEEVTDQKSDIMSSIYVENGFIKVEGSDEYTITNLSGNLLPHDSQLLSGLYIVTINGQNVKVIVK